MTSTLAELWREAVGVSGSRIAISDAQDQFTYDDLDAQREVVKRQLLQAGVQANQAVMINARAGFGFIAAVLAARELDLVVVAQSPLWPTQFLDRVLKQTAPAAILDSEGGVTTCELPPRIYPDGCFSVVQTSGSVGTPKSVLILESALLHRLRWFWGLDEKRPDNHFLIHKSPALVAAAPEYLQGLLRGESSYVLTPSRNPLDIWQQLEERRVSHCFATPSWWSFLSSAFRQNGGLSHVRLATCSAEPFRIGLAAQLRDWLPNARLFNLYGASECSSNASYFELPKNHATQNSDFSTVPIGRAIAGNTLRIAVTNDGNAQAVSGELCVSGACLALGYLSPQSDMGVVELVNARAEFCTGDIATLDGSGNLVLEGRMDNRIDHNGYAVQPEPLEQLLLAQPGVQAAAVGGYVDIRGSHRLAALVQLKRLAAGGLSELRETLRRELPTHLMPQLRVGEVPTTEAGKVDRRQLAQLLRIETDVFEGVEPNSAADLEAALLDYLGASHEDRCASFFDLGGTSLTAIELLEAVFERTNVNLDPQQLFVEPRVDMIAEVIWRETQSSFRSPPGASLKHARDTFTLTQTQQAMVFAEGGSRAAANVLQFAYCVPDHVDEERLRLAFESAIAAHPIMRIQIVGPADPVRMSSETNTDSWSETQRLNGGGTISEFISAQAANRINPGKGRMVCGGMLQTDSGERVFYILVHHLVFDGWSRKIFLQSMSSAYGDVLPRREQNFIDFAATQQSWEDGNGAAEAKAFWLNELRGAPHRSALPENNPDGLASDADGHVLEELPAAWLTRLQHRCAALGVSVNSALLGAFYLALTARTGQDDLIIGVPFVNRRNKSHQQSVGCFMTLLPVRLSRGAENQTTDQLLAHIHDKVVRGMQHARYPLARIVSDLALPRSSESAPLVQTVLNVFERSWADLMLDGQSLEEMQTVLPASPNELYVSIRLSPSGTQLSAQYYADKYLAQSVADFLKSFEHAVTRLCEGECNVNALIAELSQTQQEAQTRSLAAGRGSRMAGLRRRRTT